MIDNTNVSFFYKCSATCLGWPAAPPTLTTSNAEWYLMGYYPHDCEHSVLLVVPGVLDPFTVLLHSPNGRHLSMGSENRGNSHRSPGPITQWSTRLSQSIFRPTNHKSLMPANWKPCLILNWQSYYQQVRTVSQSMGGAPWQCRRSHKLIWE